MGICVTKYGDDIFNFVGSVDFNDYSLQEYEVLVIKLKNQGIDLVAHTVKLIDGASGDNNYPKYCIENSKANNQESRLNHLKLVVSYYCDYAIYQTKTDDVIISFLKEFVSHKYKT